MEQQGIVPGDSKSEKTKQSRRRFLNVILSGAWVGFLTAIIYPVTRYIIPPKQREPVLNSIIAARVGELKPNSGKVFPFGREPAILINTPAGDLRAFSAVCTHLACTVQYREDFEHIWCACHNGHYDLTGRNIAGPPPRPLPRYLVEIMNDDVWVVKDETQT